MEKSQKVVLVTIIILIIMMIGIFAMCIKLNKEKYNNFQIENNVEEPVATNNVETNDNNSSENITDAEYAKSLFNQYKLEIQNTISSAYSKLDEEYKNKKFDTLEKFEEYINNNKTRYYTMTISKYQKTETDNYTQYVCVDKNGYYYIFRLTPSMDYTVILDTYTIDLPEFIAKYEKADETTKVAYNIDKIKQAISENDLQYVYNKLDATFKQNNFADYNKFEQYLKSNITKFEYKNASLYGNLYVATIKISDTKEMKIIMKLSTNTDFSISFNIG
ncbi:MAG: hypothetical protein ACI4VQ_07340 [Clostridia bacterium]